MNKNPNAYTTERKEVVVKKDTSLNQFLIAATSEDYMKAVKAKTMPNPDELQHWFESFIANEAKKYGECKVIIRIQAHRLSRKSNQKLLKYFFDCIEACRVAFDMLMYASQNKELVALADNKEFKDKVNKSPTKKLSLSYAYPSNGLETDTNLQYLVCKLESREVYELAKTLNQEGKVIARFNFISPLFKEEGRANTDKAFIALKALGLSAAQALCSLSETVTLESITFDKASRV